MSRKSEVDAELVRARAALHDARVLLEADRQEADYGQVSVSIEPLYEDVEKFVERMHNLT